ncbi:helix-turn-helix domain-containing protein [Aquamicrobium sp. LC103]|uniref:MerR family transcriptional regulator n=1 Tax=Aquamicrobium sp. LC103 TaxID=1120658 RepID=UPI00063EACD3|nr:helix-turn-helix domain-containing protein [Aquamicrobium sp. LC103]TKT78392.1 MerR family transcriptional regulator [Aquamicrobium sp. LC103]
MNLSIGELSKRTGVKIPTIRYYEQIGLLSEGRRDQGNRRRYEQAAVDRLNFVRHARDMGFEIEAIRDLLHMTETPQQSCHEADSIARAHLADVQRRIRQLEILANELNRMISECRHGRLVDCRIISVLSDHSQCHADHAGGRNIG